MGSRMKGKEGIPMYFSPCCYCWVRLRLRLKSGRSSGKRGFECRYK